MTYLKKKTKKKRKITLLEKFIYTGSITTWLITLFTFVAFLLVFIFCTKFWWISLVICILFNLYAYSVWFHTIYRMVNVQKYKFRSATMILVVDFFFIFIITVLQNTCIYSVISLIDKNAFVGLEITKLTPINNLRTLFLCWYLATDTSVMAGSGAINPNYNSETLLGFLFISLNYIQGIFIYIIISFGLTRALQKHIFDEIKKKRKENPHKKINKNT